MKAQFLRYICDLPNDNIGFVLEGVDTSIIDATMRGNLIAHDLLEHCHGLENIGSVDDELYAFGGILFVRPDWSEYYYNRNQEETMAYDLLYLFDNFDQNALTPVKRAQHCDARETIENCLRAAYRLAKRELDPEQLKPFDNYLEAAKIRMEHGYNKRKRYFRGDQNRACATFWHIEKAIDEFKYPMEYMKYRLSFDQYGAKIREAGYID